MSDFQAYMEQAMLEARQALPLIQQPGVIAVISGDRSTYPQMVACLSHVVLHGGIAAGSTVWWQSAGGGQLARIRSEFSERAAAEGYGWLWLIDDDNSFTYDTLHRLLQHNVDVVVPVVLQRHPPHKATMWAPWPIPSTATDADLVAGFKEKAALDNGPTGRRVFPAPGTRGLVEIGHGSTGGMLIATRVLRSLPNPHFQFGRIHPSLPQEDTWFCLCARRAGFRLWCDLETPIGHHTSVGVWPKRNADGTIGSSYEFRESLSEKMRERLGYTA